MAAPSTPYPPPTPHAFGLLRGAGARQEPDEGARSNRDGHEVRADTRFIEIFAKSYRLGQEHIAIFRRGGKQPSGKRSSFASVDVALTENARPESKEERRGLQIGECKANMFVNTPLTTGHSAMTPCVVCGCSSRERYQYKLVRVNGDLALFSP
eukprot:scaffold287_cov337-Pavlova_lutheri.AAC.256